tara:strand:- start:3269 stop:3814 length:546 start_codon:yes stop_codon:yes gene_type:complete
MREQFWKELNEARKNNQVKHWPGMFPEASIINFETMLTINQYVSRVTNHDTVMDQYSSHLPGIETRKEIKSFYIEFLDNYEPYQTETIINCSLFWSLSDKHHSIYMHRDEETVLLIQGVGEVAYALSNEEASKNSLIQIKTGDALLLPRLIPHKSIPLEPRVTLSIGAMSSKPAMATQPLN